MVQLMPLPPTVSCFSKIQIGFTFLVPAYPASPGRRAVKRVCVCITDRFNGKGTRNVIGRVRLSVSPSVSALRTELKTSVHSCYLKTNRIKSILKSLE